MAVSPSLGTVETPLAPGTAGTISVIAGTPSGKAGPSSGKAGTPLVSFNKPEPSPRVCHDCSGKPVAPLTINIESESVLSITEPFLIKAVLTATSDWKDAVLKIDLGDNLLVNSGEIEWSGPIRANTPVEVSVYASFIKKTTATVSATGGLNLKNGTRLFKAVGKEIYPPGVLLKSTSSMKTAITKTLPGVVEVMGVER